MRRYLNLLGCFIHCNKTWVQWVAEDCTVLGSLEHRIKFGLGVISLCVLLGIVGNGLIPAVQFVPFLGASYMICFC
jgi:hypothetical protein